MQSMVVLVSVVVVIFCNLMVCRSSEYRVTFLEYKNPGGRNYNNEVCEGKGHFDKICEFYFKIVFRLCGKTEKNLNTVHYVDRKNIINFRSKSPPISFATKVPPACKGPLEYRIDVWEFDDNDDDFIETFSGNVFIESWDSTKTVIAKRPNSQISSLTFTVSLHCKANHYGLSCYKKCLLSEDDKKNYRCSAQGEKVCRAGRYGKDCTKICSPGYDKNGYYTCSADGDKVCNPNFFGRHCNKHCAPRNDNFSHYECSDDGDKVCHEHSYGVFCSKFCVPKNDSCQNCNCTENGEHVCSTNQNNSHCLTSFIDWISEFSTEKILTCVFGFESALIIIICAWKFKTRRADSSVKDLNTQENENNVSVRDGTELYRRHVTQLWSHTTDNPGSQSVDVYCAMTPEENEKDLH